MPFSYDDIKINYDSTISNFDGEVPESLKFYRVTKLGKVDSSGYMGVEIELIQRPADANIDFDFDPGFMPGTSPSVPEVEQAPYFYRVSSIDIVPGSGYKSIVLEKVSRPIDYTG